MSAIGTVFGSKSGRSTFSTFDSDHFARIDRGGDDRDFHVYGLDLRSEKSCIV